MAILYPISLVNLVVEVGTRHSRQILLFDPKIHTSVKFESKRIYKQFIQKNASEDRTSQGYVYGKKRVDVNFANIMHYLRHKIWQIKNEVLIYYIITKEQMLFKIRLRKHGLTYRIHGIKHHKDNQL